MSSFATYADGERRYAALPPLELARELRPGRRLRDAAAAFAEAAQGRRDLRVRARDLSVLDGVLSIGGERLRLRPQAVKQLHHLAGRATHARVPADRDPLASRLTTIVPMALSRAEPSSIIRRNSGRWLPRPETPASTYSRAITVSCARVLRDRRALRGDREIALRLLGVLTSRSVYSTKDRPRRMRGSGASASTRSSTAPRRPPGSVGGVLQRRQRDHWT